MQRNGEEAYPTMECPGRKQGANRHRRLATSLSHAAFEGPCRDTDTGLKTGGQKATKGDQRQEVKFGQCLLDW
jgi:hypothetical protein